MIRARSFAATVTVALGMSTVAFAVVPDSVPNLPVLEAETLTGSLVVQAAAPSTPSVKTVDGSPADWTGSSTRIGGTTIASKGELVYQNYLNSGWGADDGYDASRLATLDQAKAVEPRTYRADALEQAAGDQFGAPEPPGAELHYGDAALSSDALRLQGNIEEARVAADATNVYVMVRTLAMDTVNPRTAVLVLLDDSTDAVTFTLPRAMGGIKTHADRAILASQGSILGSLHNGVDEPCTGCTVASNGSGFTNTIEIGIPRALLSGGSPLRIGIAAGVNDSATSPTGLGAVGPAAAPSDLISVAFRSEPARIWMDEDQALALWNGNIDRWLVGVDPAALAAGASQTFTQKPGYYEATYVDNTSPALQYESMDGGYYQGPWGHYGVYLPQSYRPGGVYGSTFWMHYRGGHAHDAAAWEPGILREFGDEPGLIVVTPSARGTSTWYTGRGMADFLDAWNDSHARWGIDADRTFLAGHSMGGWASYLLGLIMPDRWAASDPEDGLLMPALCIGNTTNASPQDGQDVNGEQMYTLLENARNVPYAILHGAVDELVPVTCALSAGARLAQLGYRFRNYTFLPYEHYSAPIWDDWRDIVKYMTQFRRDANPAHVTYKTWPLLEHDLSTINTAASGHGGGPDLGLRFNRAYWVSNLNTRTAGLAPTNIGSIDATTWGRGVPNVLTLPEAGTAGQPEPYVMFGQSWLPNGGDAPENRFAATLTNLATATLDTVRMALSTNAPITATITSDGPTTLTLAGTWASAPSVTGASASYIPGALTLTLPAGTTTITIAP